jgi:hypothetical protein
MLTIRNYHKLCDKLVGKDGWKVLFATERDNHYEIKLVCVGKTSVTICLERNAERANNNRMAYMFRNWNGELTEMGVTSDWISDMDNLLTALEPFTF